MKIRLCGFMIIWKISQSVILVNKIKIYSKKFWNYYLKLFNWYLSIKNKKIKMKSYFLFVRTVYKNIIICFSFLIIFSAGEIYAQKNDKNYTNQIRVQNALTVSDLFMKRYPVNYAHPLIFLFTLLMNIFFASSVPEGFTSIDKDTYFRFASNTKNFTSTAIIEYAGRRLVKY